MARLFILLGMISVAMAFTEHFAYDNNNRDWMKEGQDLLKKNVKATPNLNKAKNVIVFIGDGMGLSTVTAGRIYKGQKKNKAGEDELLTWDTFPYTALSKTYAANHQIPDSAATANAILTGQKTNFGVAGVNMNVERSECDKEAANKINGIMDWSLAEGKSGGVISTARITHATPAATYANTAERRWEGDSKVPDLYKGKCKDIARQLIEDNPGINVILGGARKYMLPNTTADPEYSTKMGDRRDGRNLIEEWKQMKTNDSKKHAYVWNKEQFDAVDAEETEYLLGLFEHSHMKYVLDRSASDPHKEPSLDEMTEKAIKMMKKNDKGFFLLVEGARIDHAHHDGKGKKALEETLEFDNAVQVALDLTSETDTLIVVTADHDHTFAMTGYVGRGNNILGYHDAASIAVEPALDNLPVLVLGYADGPGPINRQDLTGVDPTGDDYLQRGKVDMTWSTHGGADVGIYARGPMSHLISGTVEQNYIGHVLAYASCVGVNKGHCNGDTPKPTNPPTPTCGSAGLNISILALLISAASVLLSKL